MKYLFLISLLYGSAFYAQDSLIISSHRFSNNELMACNKSKNQLVFLDSLISQAISEHPPAKGNVKRFFKIQNEKLVIFHINAGWICNLRGEFDQAHEYFDNGESYLDSLKKYDLYDDELKTIYGAYNNIQKQICYDTYQKDTAIFYAWDCAKFFPELNNDLVISSDTLSSNSTNTTILPNDKHPPTIKYPNWGEFYINDTLRINKHFVSDSNSIVYFKKLLQPLLIIKLLQNPSYFEILGDTSINLIRDTVIYKLYSKYEKGKYERNCEIVFTSSQHPERFDHIMLLMSNIEFPGFIRDLEIYIPLVLTTELSINNNVYVHDDHFRIEIKKIKQIDPK